MKGEAGMPGAPTAVCVGHWLNRLHGERMGLLGRGHDKTLELSTSPGTPSVILISGAVAGQSHPIL